tara:strand:- start:131 stop:298 length:168 start_codon:yes stop_codon:yes gene_type:complete
MILPNFRNWNRKILKDIIDRCNTQEIIYFDIYLKNNLQYKAFAMVEYYKPKERNK